MSEAQDQRRFSHLIGTLGAYVDRLVIVGGWAHRLYRAHPLAQSVPYAPLMTIDADVAMPPDLRTDKGGLRERLLANDFTEEFLGDDRPPVTQYQLEGDTAGFYAEFLTPLVGGEFRRSGKRDVTASLAGVTAQKLRHVDVLLIAPWDVSLELASGPTRVRIANPVSYIVQKLLISARRRPEQRAKDILYVHDTLELFGRVLPDLHRVWSVELEPRVGTRTRGKTRLAAARLVERVTDDVREAARISGGRVESPQRIIDACRVGLDQMLA